MKRLLALVAMVSALALVYGALTATPASAAGPSYVRASNGVLFDSKYPTYRYAVNVPSNAEDWDLDIDLIGPDGSVADSDYLFDGSDRRSGSGKFYLSSYDRPGRYKIRATLTWYDYYYNSHEVKLPVDTFTMRKARSRTGLSVSTKRPKFNRVVKFKTKSKVERPSGYFSARYEYVRPQVRYKGSWRNFKRSKQLTSYYGNSSQKWRWNIRGAHKVRAVTLRSTEFTSSYSNPVRIRAKKARGHRQAPITSLIAR